MTKKKKPKAGYRYCPDCTSSGYDSPDFYCEDGPQCRYKQKDQAKKMVGDTGIEPVTPRV